MRTVRLCLYVLINLGLSGGTWRAQNLTSAPGCENHGAKKGVDPQAGGIHQAVSPGLPVYILDWNTPLLNRVISAPSAQYPGCRRNLEGSNSGASYRRSFGQLRCKSPGELPDSRRLDRRR